MEAKTAQSLSDMLDELQITTRKNAYKEALMDVCRRYGEWLGKDLMGDILNMGKTYDGKIHHTEGTSK